MPKKKNRNKNSNTRSGFAAFLRRPAVQIGILAVVALIVYLIAVSGSPAGTAEIASLPATVSAEQAYEMYQQPDVFVLDVREQFEWDEYHITNTTLIPLDELQSRVGEVPQDKKVVVVCRSGNRSDEGRDILLAAGYAVTSMDGGLKDWYAKGYPTEGTPSQ
jgi:rhodanese-related sulfurtransferase